MFSTWPSAMGWIWKVGAGHRELEISLFICLKKPTSEIGFSHYLILHGFPPSMVYFRLLTRISSPALIIFIHSAVIY